MKLLFFDQSRARISLARAIVSLFILCLSYSARGQAPAKREHTYEDTLSLDPKYRQKLTLPVQNRSIEDHAAREIINVFLKVTNNQNNKNPKLKVEASAASVANDDEYTASWDALSSDSGDKSNQSQDQLKQYLSTELNKAISEIASQRLGFIERFKSGLSFDFDFGSFFSERTSDTDTHAQKDSVSYGLVLKEIEMPNEENLQAALNRQTDWSGSLVAKPVWTIAPIKKPVRRQPFQATVPQTLRFESVKGAEAETGMFVHTKQHSAPQASMYQKFLSMIRPPKVKFKGKMVPLQTGGTNPLDAGWKISLQQVQNLYAIDIVTNHLLKSESVEHRMNLPLIGSSSLTRTYDEDLSAKSTTIHNILLWNHLPSVFVTYLDETEQVKAGMKFRSGNHQITFTAEGSDESTPETGEKYHINYILNF